MPHPSGGDIPLSFAFPQRLYPIVGDAGAAPDCVAQAEAILAQGIRLIQLRIKARPTGELVALARRVKRLCDARGALLIVNDRVDVARLVGADGVHLGQDDLPPAAARALLPPGSIIGHSTHNEHQLAAALRADGADYLAFGPVFATHSKSNPDPVAGLNALRTARRSCPLPLVAIGGIDRSNLRAVLDTGVDCVAVIGAIAGAADVGRATAEMLRLAESH